MKLTETKTTKVIEAGTKVRYQDEHTGESFTGRVIRMRTGGWADDSAFVAWDDGHQPTYMKARRLQVIS